MREIFIIPFELPWNWSADYQKQTILELKKRKKNVIAYMNRDSFSLFKKIKKTNYPKIKNVNFFRPVNFIPFKRYSFIRNINQFFNLLILRIRFINKKIYFWSFDPDFYQEIRFANLLKITTIYDCVDYHSHIDKKINKQIKNFENKSIKNSKYFFVNSRELLKIHNKKKKPILVSQGFDLKTFEKNKKKKSLLKKIKKPIVGYVGGINYRLDYDLLIKLVKNNQNWQFVFWGPIQNQENNQLKDIEKKQIKLFSFKNVHHGESKKINIPQVIKQFDVCLIPYNNQLLFNKYSYPMKIFEYFYAQKPVVSSPINEFKTFSNDLISIAKNYKEWKRKIREKIDQKELPKIKKAKKELAISNSWKNKVSEILKVVK